MHARGGSGSVHLENDTLLVTGGGTGRTLIASELLGLSRLESVEGPRLPGQFKHHCTCHFNESHIFMGAGIETDTYLNYRSVKYKENAYLLNLELGEWAMLPAITPIFRVSEIQSQPALCKSNVLAI